MFIRDEGITANKATMGDIRFMARLDVLTSGEEVGDNYYDERTDHWRKVLSDTTEHSIEVFTARRNGAFFAGYLCVRYDNGEVSAADTVISPNERQSKDEVINVLLKRAGLEYEAVS